MSIPSAASLVFASQQVVIYVGIFLFIVGIIGGPLTLLVFLSLRTFRQSSCAFYLTVMSVVNILILFVGLITFIMINGFAINWLNTSIFYCKFRPFYVQLCVLISYSCMCLATIDQFLATYSQPRWYRWNNIKSARYILTGITITWILHGIPFLLYYGHIESSTAGQYNCIITNVGFQKYYNYFETPILVSCLPVTIMIVFGSLAYRNIQQLAHRTVPLVRRELDKQLTVMVLVEVCYDIITLLPIIILTIFNIIFDISNNPSTAALLNFISIITSIIYYFHFVGSFYIYICVSKRFRQQSIHVLFTILFNRFRPRRVNNNQIEPQA